MYAIRSYYGLLLLSGGIDSPVAGWLMGKRGLKQDAIYFHTYPYTSDEARQKVVDLAGILAKYTCGMTVITSYSIHYTKLYDIFIVTGWATVIITLINLVFDTIAAAVSYNFV